MNNTTSMKSSRFNREFRKLMYAIAAASSCACWRSVFAGKRAPRPIPMRPGRSPTPQAAADALIDAAEKFDVPALEAIFGPGGKDIIHTGEAGPRSRK